MESACHGDARHTQEPRMPSDGLPDSPKLSARGIQTFCADVLRTSDRECELRSCEVKLDTTAFPRQAKAGGSLTNCPSTNSRISYSCCSAVLAGHSRLFKQHLQTLIDQLAELTIFELPCNFAKAARLTPVLPRCTSSVTFCRIS